MAAGLHHPELKSRRGRFISRPEEFSGGEKPGQANFVFRELDFTVEKIGETRPDQVERRDWTAAEVSLIVAAYFDMLRLDPAGQEFVKAERNPALHERLNGRNRISSEFEHQNISAVLLDLELSDRPTHLRKQARGSTRFGPLATLDF